MKKFKSIIALIVVIYGCLFATSNVKALTLSTPETSQTIDSNSSGTITLKFDEKVKSFVTYMKYDPEVIEIVAENSTFAINPEYSAGVASIAYLPQDGSTEDTFKISIKTKQVTEEKNSELKLTNISAMNTTDSAEKSLENVIINITVKAVSNTDNNTGNTTSTDNTTSDTKLSKTGGSDMILILIIATIASAIIFKMKSKKMKKLFIMLPILVAVATFGGKNVEAATTTAVGEYGVGKFRIDFIDTEKKYIGISPNASCKIDTENDNSNKVLPNDLNEFLEKNNITTYDSSNTTPIKNGDTIGESYTIIVYSDVNRDSNLFSSADWTSIADHILKRTILDKTSNEFKAADVSLDNLVNISDLYRMRNKMLGYDSELGDTLTAIKTLRITENVPNEIEPNSTTTVNIQVNPPSLVESLKEKETVLDVSFANTNLSTKSIEYKDAGNIQITVESSETVGDNEITIKINKMSVSVTCNVKEKNKIGTLNISPKIIEVGNEVEKTATLSMKDSDKEDINLSSAEISSNNTSVATVDGIKVIGVGKGTATITVKAQGYAEVTIPIEVCEKFSELTADSKITGDALSLNQSETLSLSYTPIESETPTSIEWGIITDTNNFNTFRTAEDTDLVKIEPVSNNMYQCKITACGNAGSGGKVTIAAKAKAKSPAGNDITVIWYQTISVVE